jgi:hypothetical protein
MEETECLADWQVRIRNAGTPGELLQIAEELRMRSEAARRELASQPRESKPRSMGRKAARSRTVVAESR